jgi:hypothetical protein
MRPADAEPRRLAEDAGRLRNWKRWGPYLAERQWGTVREDYSAGGTAWDYFPHDHARSRAYRWGEDGLCGFTDRQCRLCFALALWNERDPILKERMFGLAGPEGNHGEDVKERWYYLDSTPTHSYVKSLYKYPQAEFPYAALVEENRRRGRGEPEYELADTGVFDRGVWDVLVEYAKATPDDVCIRVVVENHGPEPAPLHVLPTLWFRNTWSWGRTGEGYAPKPRIVAAGPSAMRAEHVTLGEYRLELEGDAPLLFCDNETHAERLWGTKGPPHPKDAFHRWLIRGERDAVSPDGAGTKAAFHVRLAVPPGGRAVLKLRLHADEPAGDHDAVFAARIAEADAFYAERIHPALPEEERRLARLSYAGLLHSKQFYHYSVRDWLEGDPAQPAPPPGRREGRNADWPHLYNRDVLLMPDKWEYPWYAAWDLAFHCVAVARVDPALAKEQLVLLLREWYMHPNGQIPAYEYAFSDVNPPVHAWAAWRVYKLTGARGKRDRVFLARVFQKLLLNFTWWVNRKDVEGKHLFAGGFLGLDNIGVFDRSKPLPTGGQLEQADGTAWMAFYCTTMLSMALELAREDPAYEDVASKFFEHFVAIVDAMNNLGLWDEGDGFYYDRLHVGGRSEILRVRSMVGVIPLFAVEVLDDKVLETLPGFRRRMQWFLENRPELGEQISYMCSVERRGECHRLLAVASRERLERVLRYVLDEQEFLSPHGVRSLSRVHAERPFRFEGHEVRYDPGESSTWMFGGNSNWRGPVWFPVNYLLLEALERHHHFHGEGLKVECPVGSGRMLTLKEVARDLARRLVSLFLPDERGRRPCHGDEARLARDPAWRRLVAFHEYFHGDTGLGLGAEHQTGWTALLVRCLEDVV